MINIVVEGIDGCGKSSHVERLVKKLGAHYRKFPNKDTPTGKAIYAHLEYKWVAKIFEASYSEPVNLPNLDPLVFQALQLMNRMEMAKELQSLFTSSKSTVLDRYWTSGFAYGAASGLDKDYLVNVHSTLPIADLYLLLDIDLENSMSRRPERRDRYERDAQFLGDVIKNYRELWLSMSKSAKPKWVVINARGSHEQTAKQIDDAIADFRGSNV